MNTKHFLFIKAFALLFCVNILNAQTNYTAPTTSTGGSNNTFVGYSAGGGLNTGNNNTFLGYVSGKGNNSGFNNIGIGIGTLENYNCNDCNNRDNIAIGYYAGPQLKSNYNILIGRRSGNSLITGGGNTFLGGVDVPNSLSPDVNLQVGSNTLNTVIIGTGTGTQRIFVHNDGRTGIGLGNNVIPQNRLEIEPAGSVTGTLGLRFRNININTETSVINPTNKVLSLNATGDVILVNDIGGGVNASCSTANFVPVYSSTANTIACSQIFDNGASVGIGTGSQASSYFNYTYSAGDDSIGFVPLSGTARLRVNGVTWSGGYYATSDKKFKREIKLIESSLETIQKIEGKTYFWNKEANKEMNFDKGLHSGFIAQELEKVLPHLVATDSDGNKAVNYMELMPYLVEAIKEQQIQINDLKSQISESFKTQNQDLINLMNTKIISVSPNPSKNVITISFNIEKSVQNASIQVFDLSGNVINSLKINDRDNNLTRTFQKENFGIGIYIVSLVVNGKNIDSKKIIFE